MPIVKVTVAGTAVPLTAGGPLPIDHACTRTTLQILPGNTASAKIYVGLPVPRGTGSAVTSTVYDAYLDSSSPSYTIGLGNESNSLDRNLIYINADNNNDGVSEAPEVV